MNKITQPMPGADIIRTAVIGLACLVVALRLCAQEQSAGSEPQDTSSTAAHEGPIMMSSFQVNSTENTGYISKNSATAFKTDESLLTIPQAVMVVTRDMITDTGYNQSSDVLRFAGVADFFRGESYELRGTRLGYDLIDELPNIIAYMDNVFIDSYEIIRGPAAVFYPTASLGGIILKTTRKPLDYAQDTVSFSENEWGNYRVELDTNHPIEKLGDGILAYRVELAYQDGSTYFNNVKESERALHPNLQWTNPQNRVLVAADIQEQLGVANGQAFLTPDGGIEHAAGERNEMNVPQPGDNATHKYAALRLQFQHHIGTGWEMKVYARLSQEVLRASYSIPSGQNFVNNASNWSLSNLDDRFKTYDVLGDFTGQYNLWGLNARSTFGFTNFKENTTDWNHDLPPVPQTSWNNIPFSQPVSHYIQIPTLSQWPIDPKQELAGGGSNDDFTAYYQQGLDVVPDRLSLVAGGSWRYIESDSVTGPYISLNFPFTTSDSILSVGEYRVGLVYQLVKKQVSLYAMRSTIASSNGSDLGPNGLPLPDQKGVGSEVGIKTDILDGKITSTTSVYDIEKTNVAQVLNYTVNGLPIFALYGKTVQKGWDTDVTWQPIDNLALVATFQQGSVETQAGLPVANAYRGMWSLFGKYSFGKTSGLAGLAIGGGGSEIHGLLEGAGSYTLSPAQAATLVGGSYIEAKAGVLANAFANYAINKHWMVSLTVDNILNENFAQGAQNAEYVDASPPLTIAGRVTFKY